MVLVWQCNLSDCQIRIFGKSTKKSKTHTSNRCLKKKQFSTYIFDHQSSIINYFIMSMKILVPQQILHIQKVLYMYHLRVVQVELENQSGLVYKIHCEGCNHTYKGLTSQYLHKSIGNHVNFIRNYKLEASTLT